MDQKFPKFAETINIHIQEAKETKKIIIRHSIFKLLKTSDKQKTLKAIREKDMYQGTKENISEEEMEELKNNGAKY